MKQLVPTSLAATISLSLWVFLVIIPDPLDDASSNEYSATGTVSSSRQAASRQTAGLEHNCSMWAAISHDFQEGVIYRHLVDFPYSLKKLSQFTNPDGWGIAYYHGFGDTSVTERGALRAFNDPYYDSLVVRIDTSRPKISIAHIRNCSSGCCCRGCDSIPNPHPFERYKDGRDWTFAHNGAIRKSILYELIGADYLEENPPSGSGIPQCDPEDTSLVIDSELYFLYLLKQIEQSDWNATEGIITALTELVCVDSRASLNFILSDGYLIWAFRKGASLYFLHAPNDGLSAVATRYPSSSQHNWQEMDNYQLVVLNPDTAPDIMDIRDFAPLVSYVPGDVNGNGIVNVLDINFLASYLMGGRQPPDCFYCPPLPFPFFGAADVNGDCAINTSDISSLANYLSSGESELSSCPDCPPDGANSRPF